MHPIFVIISLVGGPVIGYLVARYAPGGDERVLYSMAISCLWFFFCLGLSMLLYPVL